MSEKSFTVNIFTPDAPLGTYTATLLVVPSEMGEVGVMANHAPMFCAIKDGECRITTADGETKKIPLDRGFMTVKNNIADILGE